jgi:hypothetical protein
MFAAPGARRGSTVRTVCFGQYSASIGATDLHVQ